MSICKFATTRALTRLFLLTFPLLDFEQKSTLSRFMGAIEGLSDDDRRIVSSSILNLILNADHVNVLKMLENEGFFDEPDIDGLYIGQCSFLLEDHVNRMLRVDQEIAQLKSVDFRAEFIK